MLSALLALLLAQQWTQVPEHPPVVAKSQAVAVLVATDSTWEARFQALAALQQHRFAKEEVAALTKALPSASTTPSGPCTHPPEPCVVEIGPCLSPAGFILTAAREADARGAFVPAALAVLDDPDEAFALPAARDVLARAGHPRAEVEALSLMTKGTYCVGAATRMLSALPKLSDEAGPVLSASFNSAPLDKIHVLAMLAARREPWAQAMATRALQHPNTKVRLRMIQALDGLAEIPAPIRPALVHVAQCDSSAVLRSHGMGALRAHGVRVTDAGCPRPSWKVENGVVTSRSGCVALTSSSTVPSSPNCTVGARTGKGDDQLAVLGLLGRDCILAKYEGEFGGALFSRHPDGSTKLIIEDESIQPVALLSPNADSTAEVLVISSLGHMTGSGAVGRLLTLPGGHYRYERWLQFMAQPMAWAYHDGRLFISFQSNWSVVACPGSTADVTLVYEPDGTSSVARSEATKCLSP
ncbi:MAG: hypothetical protein QM765_31505 [Myxococcales bacterium]